MCNSFLLETSVLLRPNPSNVVFEGGSNSQSDSYQTCVARRLEGAPRQTSFSYRTHNFCTVSIQQISTVGGGHWSQIEVCDPKRVIKMNQTHSELCHRCLQVIFINAGTEVAPVSPSTGGMSPSVILMGRPDRRLKCEVTASGKLPLR